MIYLEHFKNSFSNEMCKELQVSILIKILIKDAQKYHRGHPLNAD